MKAEETIIAAPNVATAAIDVGSELGSHRLLDDFALAYHRAVAEALRSAPENVIDHARRNLARWLDSEAFDAGESASLEEWREILDHASVEQLITIITDESDEGQRLRQSSPFAGAISHQQRLEILAACEKRASA